MRVGEIGKDNAKQQLTYLLHPPPQPPQKRRWTCEEVGPLYMYVYVVDSEKRLEGLLWVLEEQRSQ
jgi:hypothetical protein